MTDRFTVLLAGDLVPGERVLRQVAGTRVIAADGGIAHAQALGLEPELWIGDFDSSHAMLHERFAHLERREHPPAKDLTDGELAIEEAIARGARSLVLAGALGGRSDHHLQHVTHLVRLAEDGLEVMMTSGREEAYPVIPGQLEIEVPGGTTFSIIALSDLTGLSLSNVEWPLSRRDVAFGSSLTVSNVSRGPVRVELAAGRAVLFASIG